MPNLHPSVYLCSETQERFMWVCSPDLTQMILDHYNKTYDLPNVSAGAKASAIGKIRSDGLFIIHNKKEEIANTQAKEVTKGFLYNRETKKPKKVYYEPDGFTNLDLNQIIVELISHENIASRKPIYEKYDKQVQGRVYKETGIADAGILAPVSYTHQTLPTIYSE